MLIILSILCVLIWLPLFVYQISHRGFYVLLCWLFIAPIAANMINSPRNNPLFRTPTDIVQAEAAGARFLNATDLLSSESQIELSDLFEPTRIVIGLFLIVFLLENIAKTRRFIGFDSTESWMCIFSIISLVNALLYSKRVNFSLHTVSDAFIVPFCAYYIVRRLVTSEAHIRQLVRVIGYLGCYIIVLCLIERLIQPALLYRLGGPFYGGGSLGIVLSVVVFTVWSDSLRREGAFAETRALPQVCQWFVLGLSPVIILLTWSRGGWIGFLLGVAVFLVLGLRLTPHVRKVPAIGLVLVLAAVIGFGAQTVASSLTSHDPVGHRIGDAHTVYGRFATWTIALQEGLQHPVFGIGLTNMRFVLSENMIRIEDAQSYQSVHQSFLEIFAEQGTVGLITYLAIAICIIRKGLNLYRTGLDPRDRRRGAGLIAIMVAYLIPSMFASHLHNANPLNSIFVYVFAGGIVGLYGQRRFVRLGYPLSTSSTGFRAAAEQDLSISSSTFK